MVQGRSGWAARLREQHAMVQGRTGWAARLQDRQNTVGVRRGQKGSGRIGWWVGLGSAGRGYGSASACCLCAVEVSVGALDQARGRDQLAAATARPLPVAFAR